MSVLCVETFLETFVDGPLQEEARISMNEIFVAMHHSLASDIFRNFKGVINNSGSESDSEEKPKKKRAPRKKKDEEKVEKVERPICSGLTASGNACKNKASENEELCHVHLKKKNDPPKEPKAKKTKAGPKEPKAKKAKKTKKTPEHNHELTEESTEDCELCETHGNKVSEGFEEEFELDGDTKSTLQAILAKASDSEESEEDNEDMQFLKEMNSDTEEIVLDMPDVGVDVGVDSPPKTRSSTKRPKMRAI